MIDPRELRIGNWVSTPEGDHQIARVYDESPIALNPIPLTAKWLERFGFELGDKLYWIDERLNAVLQLNQINPNNEWWDVVIKDKFADHGFWLRSVTYVHQLQNLYFSLTGNELTLKDKQ